MEFIDKLKGFLMKPSKAFKSEQKTNVGNALKYGLLGLVILGILTVLITLIFGSAIMPIPGLGGATSIAVFFAVVVGGFLSLIIGGAWIHLWAFVFGARQGIGNTIKTVFYGYSPVYVLGWIPIINFFARIWYLVLIVIGLTKLQKMSTGRAIGAVVVAIIIPLIIFAALIFWAISLIGPEVLAGLEQLSSLS